jgi:hypothetical protein
VEIPSDGDRPSVRFLIQVKTSENIRSKRNNHWSIKFDRAALNKYLRSRHAVIAFRVNLASDEIRWLDVLAAAKATPKVLTFDVPPGQAFNQGTVPEFVAAVHLAIAELDDTYHPPAKAAAYRAQSLEKLDPRFKVKLDVVNGVERYTIGAKPGRQPSLGIITKSQEDDRKIRSAVEFGSKVSIRGQLIGSPIVEHGELGNSILRLEPGARHFQLGITAEGGGHRLHIVLPGENSFGTRGMEFRTEDPNCPISLTIQWDREHSLRSYDLAIDFWVWDGKQVLGLPLFEKTREFARCLSHPHSLQLDYMEYGETKVSILGQAQRADADFDKTLQFLEVIGKLRVVCRELGVDAVFKCGVPVTREDAVSIIQAYGLLEGRNVPWGGKLLSFPVGENAAQIDEMLNSGAASLNGLLAHVNFAGTEVAKIEVRADLKEFEVVSRSEGSIQIKTLAGSTITRVAPQ